VSQERWDVVLAFTSGPLSFEGDLVLRGPVVRIGANPGPGGLATSGYRGVDDRHAVITAYDGGSVAIAPVGQNPVRVAPHPHVDWAEVQPIRGPVYLSEGCAVHLGPIGRGATAVFKESRRLGAWEQRAILSEAAQAERDDAARAAESQVRELDVRGRIPWWFLPGLGLVVAGTIGAVLLVVVVVLQRRVEPLGPVEQGREYYEPGDVFEETETDPGLYEGIDRGFAEFVMSPNISVSGQRDLLEPAKWDGVLRTYVTRSMQMLGRAWRYYGQLDRHAKDYAMVLGELRKAGLPDVLAAVPLQESRYDEAAWDSMLCAAGWWQFQPEVAKRYQLEVSACPFKDGGEPWSPTLLAAPRNAIKNADYVAEGQCRMKARGCARDERLDRWASTAAAVKKFAREGWSDPDFRRSGAHVQLVIATHNAGYDDSPWRNGQVSETNIKVAYAKWRREKKVDRQPDFWGLNITCSRKEEVQKLDAENINARCGSYVPNVTQTYVPLVIAQHLVAACYYGSNYASSVPEFEKYRQHVVGNGYCSALDVPTPEDVRRHQAGGS
jgi:hypothetical protein